MKKLLIAIFLCLPMMGMAQSEWERPMSYEEKLEQAKKAEAEAKKAQKEAKAAKKQAEKAAKEARKASAVKGDKQSKEANVSAKEAKPVYTALSTSDKDYKYLKPGAVPEVDGKVVFTLDADVKGASAQQIYDRTYAALDSLSQQSNQIKSGILLVNKKEHSIAAQYNEWMTFKSSFINLDRTKFNYTIIATCSDGHLHLTLERINYSYEEDRSTALKTTAEKWISDKYAVNKKGNKLQIGSAKFRRCTIDRKDQIFAMIKKYINK